MKCADTGLAAVREVRRLCAQGRVDLELGRREDARTAFTSALEKNPNAACAQDGIDKSRPNFVSRALDWLSNAIPDVLTALGILVALVFGVLLLGHIGLVYRGLIRTPLLGRLISPRMTIAALEDGATEFKVGAAIASRIRERLERFREEALRGGRPDYELDLGTGGDEFADLVSGSGRLKDALDKTREVSEHTKIVTALVDLLYALLPIRVLTVSGVCEPANRAGVGATFSLERNARLEAAVSLTGPPLTGDPTAVDYLPLAQPAAVWIQYEVARVLAGGVVDTHAAESYALVRAGLDRQLAGLDDAARLAYQQALTLNPRNWPALVNLAVLEARLTGNYPRAIAILEEALDEMQRSR